jgi:putative ABC transport system ATP-binding protein
MMPLIELKGLEKSIASKAGATWVLRQIDLEVAAGEFISVMGPSGSGKSTLLNVLGFFDADFGGSYRFDGVDTAKIAPKARADLGRTNVGFIFQHYHLLDDLTVAENLEVPLSYRDVKASERNARVADALDRFNIVGKKDLYPNQLSGGQQQLVAVARAVIASPKLILADEPTGALHSSQGRMIMDLLGELNAAGTTIVQVTHNDEYAARGTRTVKLFDGWLEAAS